MLYDMLSPVYDRINREIDYCKWADFIEKILENHGIRNTTEPLLDLACGTGKMTIELASRGYDMIGVDISPEMLNTAACAARRRGISDRILWLCQDMTEFELFGTVDAVVCCLDSINHLTAEEQVTKCFSLVHNYLSPGGIFVFDINGKHKFESVYADNTYVYDLKSCFCTWQNKYSKRTKICDFYVTMFSKNGDAYNRFDDIQTERMYRIHELKKMLEASGFEFIGAYSDYSFTAATDLDDRIYIVAKCLK